MTCVFKKALNRIVFRFVQNTVECLLVVYIYKHYSHKANMILSYLPWNLTVQKIPRLSSAHIRCVQ